MSITYTTPEEIQFIMGLALQDLADDSGFKELRLPEEQILQFSDAVMEEFAKIGGEKFVNERQAQEWARDTFLVKAQQGIENRAPTPSDLVKMKPFVKLPTGRRGEFREADDHTIAIATEGSLKGQEGGEFANIKAPRRPTTRSGSIGSFLRAHPYLVPAIPAVIAGGSALLPAITGATATGATATGASLLPAAPVGISATAIGGGGGGTLGIAGGALGTGATVAEALGSGSLAAAPSVGAGALPAIPTGFSATVGQGGGVSTLGAGSTILGSAATATPTVGKAAGGFLDTKFAGGLGEGLITGVGALGLGLGNFFTNEADIKANQGLLDQQQGFAAEQAAIDRAFKEKQFQFQQAQIIAQLTQQAAQVQAEAQAAKQQQVSNAFTNLVQSSIAGGTGQANALGNLGTFSQQALLGR